MNEVIRQTALFVRDLLTYDEQLIRLGRQNYDIEDFAIAYIGVDTLGASVRMGGGEKFDPVAEVMSYQRQELTLNVQFGISVNIDTLRIDTEQINLNTDIGTETYP